MMTGSSSPLAEKASNEVAMAIGRAGKVGVSRNFSGPYGNSVCLAALRQ